MLIAGDGCLDPASFVTALSRAAKQLGGKIYTNTEVTGKVSHTNTEVTGKVSHTNTEVTGNYYRVKSGVPLPGKHLKEEHSP